MADDLFLDRFVKAQQAIYPAALAEIRAGRKQTHWMWFVFPQLAGLGRSETARHYAIPSIDSARAYLAHPVLGPRYRECVAAVRELPSADPARVFGDIDAVKLRSSLTLFERAEPAPLFADVLDRWFGGTRDAATIRLLDG